MHSHIRRKVILATLAYAHVGKRARTTKARGDKLDIEYVCKRSSCEVRQAHHELPIPSRSCHLCLGCPSDVVNVNLQVDERAGIIIEHQDLCLPRTGHLESAQGPPNRGFNITGSRKYQRQDQPSLNSRFKQLVVVVPRKSISFVPLALSLSSQQHGRKEKSKKRLNWGM